MPPLYVAFELTAGHPHDDVVFDVLLPHAIISFSVTLEMPSLLTWRYGRAEFVPAQHGMEELPILNLRDMTKKDAGFSLGARRIESLVVGTNLDSMLEKKEEEKDII